MSINAYGPLFNKGTTLTPAVRRAAKKAAAYGLFRLRARSPVRTGEMRQGWNVSLQGYGIQFNNPVPYTIYNEMGTKYMRRSPMLAPTMPETVRVFQKELGKEIGRALANKVMTNVGSDFTATKSAPSDSDAYAALTNSRSNAKQGFKVGAKAGKNDFDFKFKGLKGYEREFKKAVPTRVGKLDSAKARRVGAI